MSMEVGRHKQGSWRGGVRGSGGRTLREGIEVDAAESAREPLEHAAAAARSRLEHRVKECCVRH